jgi:hypothetical protein
MTNTELLATLALYGAKERLKEIELERGELLQFLGSDVPTATVESTTCQTCGKPCGTDECFECWRTRAEPADAAAPSTAAPKRKRNRFMSVAERKAVGRRMKAYWKQWRESHVS